MKVIDIALKSIDVGERRRESLGDIGALAAGMTRVGLLEPIIVVRKGKDRYRLVAGERRLRAATSLKWTTIAARLLQQLTESELRDIEIEENLNRLPLSKRELARTFGAAKRIVEDAEKAREVLKKNVKTPNPKGGRPAKDDVPQQEVAEALGVKRVTLRNAEEQVSISERYPFLQASAWRYDDVMTFRMHLWKLETREEQDALVEFILRDYAPILPEPRQAVPFAIAMARKSLEAREEIYRLSRSEDERDRTLATTRGKELPPMPDLRIAILENALTHLRKAVKPPFDNDPEANRIREEISALKKIQNELRERYEELKREEVLHVREDSVRPQQEATA
jgi:ParB family chromosome partitioning protein